jgi:hypothetical protein
LLRAHFPGPDNAGLRRAIRERAGNPRAIRGLAGKVAVDASGRCALETIAANAEIAGRDSLPAPVLARLKEVGGKDVRLIRRNTYGAYYSYAYPCGGREEFAVSADGAAIFSDDPEALRKALSAWMLA